MHPLATEKNLLKKISETSVGLMRSTRIVQKFFFERLARNLEQNFFEVKRGRLLNRSSSSVGGCQKHGLSDGL